MTIDTREDSGMKAVAVNAAAASPFDLLITQQTFNIDWSGRLATRFPTLNIASVLRGRLWRELCADGKDGTSCATRGERAKAAPICEHPDRCMAHRLFPFAAKVGSNSHLTPTLVFRAKPLSSRSHALTLNYLGRSALPSAASVIRSVIELVSEGIGEADRRIPGVCTPISEQSFTMADHAAGLEGDTWLINLQTPWIVSKDAGTRARTSSETDLSRFVSEFANAVGQRAYKFAALELMERRREDKHSPSNADAQACCAAAKSTAIRDLALLDCNGLRLDRFSRSGLSGSNQQDFALQCVSGWVRMTCTSKAAATRCAAWLAVLDIFGGGAMTAEGYGAVEVRTTGKSRPRTPITGEEGSTRN